MKYAKFWVAVVMAVAAFLRAYLGYDFGVDETTANTIVAAITAALVWLIPNKEPAKKSDPMDDVQDAQ